MNEHDLRDTIHYDSSHAEAGPADVQTAVDSETRQWAMVIHFSQLANCVVPPAGFIAPIVIWLLKKESLPGLDAHGRNAANWLLSELIYLLLGVLLLIVVIGIPMLIVIGLLSIAFPIIAGIKASSGEAWRYPGAFRIF